MHHGSLRPNLRDNGRYDQEPEKRPMVSPIASQVETFCKELILDMGEQLRRAAGPRVWLSTPKLRSIGHSVIYNQIFQLFINTHVLNTSNVV